MDRNRRPLLARLRPGNWLVVDCGITALLVLWTLAEHDLALLSGPRWLRAVIVASAVLPAAVRRLWPRSVLALVVVAGVVATALSRSPHVPLAVGFVVYLIPLRFPRREALWLLAGTLAVLAVGVGVYAGISHPGGDMWIPATLMGDGLLVAASWLAGFAVWQQRAYLTSVQELAREEAERQAREAVAEVRRISDEERLQIARELHDVVAHTVSVIAVEAGVANYVVATHPQEAARALASIEATSRGALREMRALLGTLRTVGTAESGQRDDALTPAPGLADLDALIQRTTDAGLRIELEVSGERSRLSAGLDLAAYRVVQEALTNVVKHARTDRCRVTVSYRDDEVEVQVTDDGTGGLGASMTAVNGSEASNAELGSVEMADGAGPGHGIIGMRERVAMYGGEFRAGPLPGRGFQVTARLPLRNAES